MALLGAPACKRLGGGRNGTPLFWSNHKLGEKTGCGLHRSGVETKRGEGRGGAEGSLCSVSMTQVSMTSTNPFCYKMAAFQPQEQWYALKDSAGPTFAQKR